MRQMGGRNNGMYKETMKGLQDARVRFSMTEYRKQLAQKLEGGPLRGYQSVSSFLGSSLLLHR